MRTYIRFDSPRTESNAEFYDTAMLIIEHGNDPRSGVLVIRGSEAGERAGAFYGAEDLVRYLDFRNMTAVADTASNAVEKLFLSVRNDDVVRARYEFAQPLLDRWAPVEVILRQNADTLFDPHVTERAREDQYAIVRRCLVMFGSASLLVCREFPGCREARAVMSLTTENAYRPFAVMRLSPVPVLHGPAAVEFTGVAHEFAIICEKINAAWGTR